MFAIKPVCSIICLIMCHTCLSDECLVVSHYILLLCNIHRTKIASPKGRPVLLFHLLFSRFGESILVASDRQVPVLQNVSSE